MITGDLVKCNDTGSLGIITKIVDKNPHTGNVDWVYHVLWTEPVHRGRDPKDRFLSWERTDNFTPLADEEYAA